MRLHLIRCAGGQSAPYLPFAICQSPVGAAPRHRHYCIPQTEIQRPDAHEDAYRAPCHRLAAEWPSICTGLAHVVSSELPPRQLPTRLALLSVPKDSRLQLRATIRSFILSDAQTVLTLASEASLIRLPCPFDICPWSLTAPLAFKPPLRCAQGRV